MRKVTAMAVFMASVASLAGCSPFAQVVTHEIGREGWELTGLVANKQIQAIRGLDHQLWIRPVEDDPIRFCVKISPPDLPMENPPWTHLDNVAAGSRFGVHHQFRYYRIPDGKTFVDVYDWYLKWFDFRTVPEEGGRG